MSKHKPLEALARAFDKEDAAQRGEPDPWKDAEDDAEWVSERLACAHVAAEAYLAARSTVPEAGKAVDEFCGHGALRVACPYCKTTANFSIASVPAPSGAEPTADQELQEVADGAWGDGPMRRRAAFVEIERRATVERAKAAAPQAVPAEDVAKLVERLNSIAEDQREYGSGSTVIPDALTEAAAALTSLSARLATAETARYVAATNYLDLVKYKEHLKAEATSLRREVDEGIEPYFARQIEWSRETFGPALRTHGVIDHIRKELTEIEADPHDLSEWIDVVILAMDGFWRHGGSAADLMPRLLAKQQKNMARSWPDWRTMSEDQAIEHNRAGASE